MIPTTMAAVLLTGHGGLDQLSYRTDVPTPRPGPDEVLIEVAAAAVNNTDINTRIGWYSKAVTSGTGEGGRSGFASVGTDSSWSGAALTLPRIQGADACGTVVAVGSSVDPGRVGDRVLVRNMLRHYVDGRPFECWTLGSECDGAYAQYLVAPARETYRVNSDWTDVELAAIPCSYSTAENMLHRAEVGPERVLVTGASGGVGLAAVQLARRRGASVTAVCSPDKSADVRRHGADQVVERGSDLVAALGAGSVDVVLDLVGGPQWPQLLDVLRRGGRYAVAGAIAGPMVELDLRTRLPQGPHPPRLHLPARRGLREPHRLRAAQRDPAHHRADVSVARHQAGPAGLPVQEPHRQARPATATADGRCEGVSPARSRSREASRGVVA